MWLWAVLLAAVVGWSVATCPESCYCHHETGLMVADCSSLPTTGGKLESLNLDRLDDTPLELIDGQFSSARQLKYLSLRNASINYIHKKAFYGAKSIIEIDLSFNYLEKLEPTVFQHLTSLATLSLRGNLIHFTSEMPFLISNSLQYLDIGLCKLRSIPRGVFYGLKRLRYLSVDGNFLKTLKYNSLPKGLKTLNLSNNLIINVPTEVISALTNLRKINLGGNPINCSCSLLNLQDWLSGRGVISDTVTCASPAEYYGISWSKVDEKRLCLAEARRVQESYNNHPLFKNAFYRDNYFENDDSYLGESVQADQPNLDAEVVFQNNDTIAMGQMMRVKGEVEEYSEKNEENEPNQAEDKSKNEETEPKENEVEEPDKTNDDLKLENIDYDLKNVETGPKENDKDELGKVYDEVKLEDSEFEVKNKDTNLKESMESDTNDALNDVTEIVESDIKSTSSLLGKKEEHNEEIEGSGDGGLELESLKMNTEISTLEFSNSGEDTHSDVEDLVKEGLIRVKASYVVPSVNNNDTSEETTELPETDDTTKDITTTESELGVNKQDDPQLATEYSTSTTTEEPDIIVNTDLKNEENDQNGGGEERAASKEQDTISPTILIPDLTSLSEIKNNISKPDDNDPESSFKSEIGEEPSEATEQDTIPPPILIPDLSGLPEVKSTISEPINKDTETITKTEIDEEPADQNTKPPPISIPVLPSPTEVKNNISKPINNTTTENGLADDHKQNNSSMVMQSPPVKEVAGAEVVLFCIATIVICLLLYSVYKCRTRSKETNTRTLMLDRVDMESSKGTEMQDLLPKPQEEEKKNNLKYQDQVTLSENVKLLTEQNENESPNFKPVASANNKIDDKNSLNNNTANGTNSKKPEIKSEIAAPVNRANPASPIQRTKAKVGIIQDSIPRTPILIQKSYNGTSNKV